MAQSKSEWRRCLFAARSALSESARCSASDTIVTRVRALSCFREARTILGYVAIGSEVEPEALFATRGASVPVFVPSSQSKGDGRAWRPHPDGSSVQPEGVCAAALAFPVVAIVPGVGFDESGTRLGRGGGFYDRALAKLRAAGPVTVVGLAFEVQIVGRLPSDQWDQPVDIVVSEKRQLIRTAGPVSNQETR